MRGNELTDASAPVAADTNAVTLVKLPGHPSDADLASYEPTYQSRVSVLQVNHANRNVNWILVGGLVALAIVGIVISGVFAVGCAPAARDARPAVGERCRRRPIAPHTFAAGIVVRCAGKRPRRGGRNSHTRVDAFELRIVAPSRSWAVHLVGGRRRRDRRDWCDRSDLWRRSFPPVRLRRFRCSARSPVGDRSDRCRGASCRSARRCSGADCSCSCSWRRPRRERTAVATAWR